jgi:hypothetical protein
MISPLVGTLFMSPTVFKKYGCNEGEPTNLKLISNMHVHLYANPSDALPKKAVTGV